MTMEEQNRILLAKILGELYRIQRHSSMPCAAGEAHIYGLLNGFEHVIDAELSRIGFISKQQCDHVERVLIEYLKDAKKFAEFKGFYDIEHDLEAGNVDRSSAAVILTYLNATPGFERIIRKMDSLDSPVECKNFEIEEYNK